MAGQPIELRITQLAVCDQVALNRQVVAIEPLDGGDAVPANGRTLTNYADQVTRPEGNQQFKAFLPEWPQPRERRNGTITSRVRC